MAAQHKHQYEFFGPIGALTLSIALTILAYSFAFICNDSSGCIASSLLKPWSVSLDKVQRELDWHGLANVFSMRTTVLVVLYYVVHLTMYAFMPAYTVSGTELTNGKRLQYRCNALSAAIGLLVALALITSSGYSAVFWSYIWEHYVEIISANILVSASIATLCYMRSFEPSGDTDRLLADGGKSGNMLYDWFIGRELNPRIKLPIFGEVDLKFFCELRPGLCGWLMLDLTYMMHQLTTFGAISDSMLLVVAFQFIYVFDSFYNEAAILTTIDITTDGFGFMLALGDLVCVPFIYSLPARYLAMHPVQLGTLGIAAVLSVQVFGYWIFRASNSQKNKFRRDPLGPSVAHLKFIKTSTGSKLLISGWWGAARHINYLGDWIMALSWCLPTGLAGFDIDNGQIVPMPGRGIPVAYFYVLWVGVLLIHREMRDEEKCAKKYGADWQEYKRIVRWRIVPWIY